MERIRIAVPEDVFGVSKKPGLGKCIFGKEIARCAQYILKAGVIEIDGKTVEVDVMASNLDKVIFQIEGIHQDNEWYNLPNAFYYDNLC
jgi:hypothetical protein